MIYRYQFAGHQVQHTAATGPTTAVPQHCCSSTSKGAREFQVQHSKHATAGLHGVFAHLGKRAE